MEQDKIGVPLGLISRRCNDWDGFCSEFGFDYYCMKEGADPEHIVKMTFKQLRKYGLTDD